jgi:four helix bundle protein
MENKAEALSERYLDFAASVFKLLKKINPEQMQKYVCIQLFRSTTSIGANYEDARGAESKQDFAHKMKIVLKESRESMY